jgi:hypothetical protein
VEVLILKSLPKSIGQKLLKRILILDGLRVSQRGTLKLMYILKCSL